MSDDFRFQLSVKIDGTHLFNVRHENATDFGTALAWAVANAEQIQLACLALGGAQKPQPAPAPHPATPPPAKPPAAPSGEVGPVLVKGVQKAILKKDGTKMKSPRFTVEFSNGKRHSTFDEVLAGAAETLAGESCYYTTDDSEYKNLTSVRRAS